MTLESSIACRSCGHTDLKQILSLGPTPLANALLTYEQTREPIERIPLDLVFCPNCALVQITETVSPERLFREYFYFSSFSDTMLRHAADIAAIMQKAISSFFISESIGNRCVDAPAPIPKVTAALRTPLAVVVQQREDRVI